MEADRKVRWASKSPYPVFGPIFEDSCWASSVESSCCKVCPGFYPGGDSILQPKPFKKAQRCIPSGPRARTVPWSSNTWTRTEPRHLQWRLHWG